MILWAILPLVMAFSNWGSNLSLDAEKSMNTKKSENWPISFMALFVGFAFFTSGFAKIYGGWLSTDGAATWQYFINVFYKTGRTDLLANYFTQLDNLYLWESLDWFVVCFETLFLPAVFFPKIFRFFCLLGVIFHFGVFLILNISFSIHIIVFLLFINWNNNKLSNSKMFNRLCKIVSTTIKKVNLIGIVVLSITYMILFYSNKKTYLVDGGRWIDWLAFILAFTFILFSVIQALKTLLNQLRET